MKNAAKKCVSCGFKLRTKVVGPFCCESCRLIAKKKAFDAPLNETEREILFLMKRDCWTTARLREKFGVTAQYLQNLAKRADAQFTADQILEFYGVSNA